MIKFWQKWSKQEVYILSSEIHKIIYAIWNKEELPQLWKESIILPIYENGDITDSITVTNYI